MPDKQNPNDSKADEKPVAHPSGATDKTVEREKKFDEEGGAQPQAPSQRQADEELRNVDQSQKQDGARQTHTIPQSGSEVGEHSGQDEDAANSTDERADADWRHQRSRGTGDMNMEGERPGNADPDGDTSGMGEPVKSPSAPMKDH